MPLLAVALDVARSACTCGLQFALALYENPWCSAGELVRQGNVIDGAVQTAMVVIVHVAGHQALRIIDILWRSGSDTLAFQALVPALQLAIALWIVR